MLYSKTLLNFNFSISQLVFLRAKHIIIEAITANKELNGISSLNILIELAKSNPNNFLNIFKGSPIFSDLKKMKVKLMYKKVKIVDK